MAGRLGKWLHRKSSTRLVYAADRFSATELRRVQEITCTELANLVQERVPSLRLMALLHDITHAEAIAEYGARLLLMPFREGGSPGQSHNMAVWCVRRAQSTRVTVHTAVARLGDPDNPNRNVRGAMLWRVRPSLGPDLHELLTPYWHLCGETFIPIGRCKARKGSVIADVAQELGRAAASSNEDVRIGNLEGHFRVDAFSWGSWKLARGAFGFQASA